MGYKENLAIKEGLYKEGISLVKEFLELNSIALPSFKRTNEKKFSGYYFNKIVFINVPKTALPTLKPKHQRWSYPGYKIDKTAVGVVAHETGHYIDELGGLKSRSNKWAELSLIKPISGYDGSSQIEAFAETMRLFILNPNLLKLGNPARYDFIIENLFLKPSKTLPWKSILPVEFHTAATNWLEKR